MDFGQINFPSASPDRGVAQFQSGSQPRSAYVAPPPDDPLADETAGTSATQRTAAKKSGSMVVMGSIIAVTLLVLGSMAAFLIVGLGNSDPDLLAQLKSSAPTGFEAVGFNGCVILMPEGKKDPRVEELPRLMRGALVKSAASGSRFFIGVAKDNPKLATDMRLSARIEHQLGIRILNTVGTERNGYPAVRVNLQRNNSFMPTVESVPVSVIEAYTVDGRFVILGCSPANSEPSTEAEVKTFYESFDIGPPTTAW